ncbi:hypothetical protein CDL15_Pgr019050 [Punica granatum]|uniref:Uncharacterized protein n=1 Tax=Punica granatum TaxID=22663 RepID=A0A218XL60_PUNGR|nr:hypothetical protein CDL15_Pgr019050 [Punica granatum]
MRLTSSVLFLRRRQHHRRLSGVSNSPLAAYLPEHPPPEPFHARAIKNCSLEQPSFANYVLTLYVKSRKLSDAHRLFDEIPDRDVRTWTTLLSGFSRVGSSPTTVLDFFRRMQVEGVVPNDFTLSTVLKSCASLTMLKLGKEVHGWIFRNGVEVDSVLGNSILDMYVKCGELNIAERLFHSLEEINIVSWNVMLGGYVNNGEAGKSLAFFKAMPFKDVVSWNTIIHGLMQNGQEGTALELLYEKELGANFNEFTFSIALSLAAALTLLDLGMQIHGHVLRCGISTNGFIRTSLIDMYCKCGKVEKASLLLRKPPTGSETIRSYEKSHEELSRQKISYSSLISGYVHKGDFESAFTTFRSMVCGKLEVNEYSVTSILSACASTGILGLGLQLHAYIIKVGHKMDVPLRSSIIDMYSKCGSLEDAKLIFEGGKDSYVGLWTSMISGLAANGSGKEAVDLFKVMTEGVKPNEVTFVAVLSACSHSGLLKEGKEYFKLMKEVYGIKPGVEHFTCMVDLYGRRGRLDEIKQFICQNGISNVTSVWKSFLSSCRFHRNVELGRWVCEKLLSLIPNDPEPYVLLSNICADDGRWEEAAKIRSQMQKRGLKKVPGQSWIQLKNTVHTFIMGADTHPNSSEIRSFLDELIERSKEIGYLPHAKLVMQDVGQEEGEMLEAEPDGMIHPEFLENPELAFRN